MITGSLGILGYYLRETFKKQYELYETDYSTMDITSREQVFDTIHKVKPDILIHAAAMTNVEQCETDIDTCYKINYAGTCNVADAIFSLSNLGTKLVFISSTGIYGKQKDDPYTEFDTPSPTTIHHKSKYYAENYIKDVLNHFLIVRTGWLFGGKASHEKNFVFNRLLELQKISNMKSDGSQFGNPTYALNLARQISVLLQYEHKGIFNCVDKAENVSRYDYVKEIARLFGLDSKVNFEKVSSSFFKRKAPVSHNEKALSMKLDLFGINVMEDWQESLKLYTEQLKKEIK